MLSKPEIRLIRQVRRCAGLGRLSARHGSREPGAAGELRLRLSRALHAYLICTSVMMWLELNYGGLM